MKKERRSYQQWLEQIYLLTKKRRLRDLNIQLGKPTTEACTASYEPSDLDELKQLAISSNHGLEVYYEALDHFLRTKAEPFQAMLTTWMSGAKAYVRDSVIPFNDAINWCQNASDPDDRKTLAKELLALCRFLTQFSHATWEAILSTLIETFGFKSYLHYNEEKRNMSIRDEATVAQEFLEQTKDSYFDSISALTSKVAKLPLEESSRYDAIYLLGLRYLDHLFPSEFNMARVEKFFESIEIPLRDNRNLKIHELSSGRQSYCIPVEIPGEIHVIVGKISGWLDLESLFHELGHAFSFLYTDPNLPVEKKDFFHSAALPESYAFLFQTMCMSKPFLVEIMGIDPEKASIVSGIHRTKWTTLARRYAAKLLVEIRNFDNVDLLEGKQYYSEVMKRETGFSYQPDTYLFDLMPDFYTLDYFRGFVGAAIIEDFLNSNFGEKWFVNPEACKLIKKWWSKGNSHELSGFLEVELKKPFDIKCFVEQLTEVNLQKETLDRVL
ncbi:MAG: hypothetical protein DRG59_08540 [Deltaproteobacteria bacterium]|nr:MAG: hypothetical protein DRG59_08540 [Deltaproteobacteria bacterium]